MVILLLPLIFVVGAEEHHSLLQARSSTLLKTTNSVVQFSDKVQMVSGVVSVFKEDSRMCAMVTKGAQAPVVGTFTRDGGMSRAVRAPFIAPMDGKYCIEDQVFSMLQRSYGIHSAHDVEDAIAQKHEVNKTDGDGEIDKSTEGKNGNTDGSIGAKDVPSTTTTTTTDGPGAHCSLSRRCCDTPMSCDPGYEPVWDPTCEHVNPWLHGEKVGCHFSQCYQCLKTGDPVLQTPVCQKYTNFSQSDDRTHSWDWCMPTTRNNSWSRGTDYEGNPYYEVDNYYYAACVNETHETDNNPNGIGVLCLGSGYQERGCNWNYLIAEYNDTDRPIPYNKTLADFNWTGTLCRFLPFAP